MGEDPTKEIGQKYETNPTVETVVQMLGELRLHMDARFDAVEARLDKIESELSSLKRKINILNEDVLEVRADLAGIDRRVSKLEESPA